ncbi:hypothetical protein RCL1_004165 [Eukaryota sp. TZLM3-RCL]
MSSLRVRPVDYTKPLEVVTGVHACEVASLSSSVPLSFSSVGIEAEELHEIHIETFIKAEEHGRSLTNTVDIPVPQVSIVQPPPAPHFFLPPTFIHHPFSHPLVPTYDLDEDDHNFLEMLSDTFDIAVSPDLFEQSVELLEHYTTNLETSSNFNSINSHICTDLLSPLFSDALAPAIGSIVDYWLNKRLEKRGSLLPFLRPRPEVDDLSPLRPFRKIVSEKKKKEKKKHPTHNQVHLKLIALKRQLLFLHSLVSTLHEQSKTIIQQDLKKVSVLTRSVDTFNAAAVVSGNRGLPLLSCVSVSNRLSKLKLLPLLTNEISSLLEQNGLFKFCEDVTIEGLSRQVLSEMEHVKKRKKDARMLCRTVSPSIEFKRICRRLKVSLCNPSCLDRLNGCTKLFVHHKIVNGFCIREVCPFSVLDKRLRMVVLAIVVDELKLLTL